VARTRRKKPTSPAVLVAEDEPTVRMLAESIIGDLGLRNLLGGERQRGACPLGEWRADHAAVHGHQYAGPARRR